MRRRWWRSWKRRKARLGDMWRGWRSAVVVEAQQNVKGYFGTAPSLHGRVDQDVDYEMEGSSATIGIRDAGNKAQRLASKQADGTFPWLQRALDSVRALFGGG